MQVYVLYNIVVPESFWGNESNIRIFLLLIDTLMISKLIIVKKGNVRGNIRTVSNKMFYVDNNTKIRNH